MVFRAAALGPEDAQDVLVAEPRGALVGLVVEGAPLPPQEEEGVEVSLGGRERDRRPRGAAGRSTSSAATFTEIGI